MQLCHVQYDIDVLCICEELLFSHWSDASVPNDKAVMCLSAELYDDQTVVM